MEPSARKPLRLWPGVVLAVIVVLLRFVLPMIASGTFIIGVMAALAGTLLILLWWVFFSRAPWSERLGAVAMSVVAIFATLPFLDKSITGGMMGRMFFAICVPATLGPALVAWAVATRRLADGLRWASMVVAILLGCGLWTLFRTDGVIGEAGTQLTWRWKPTAEERLLARGDEPTVIPPAPAATGVAKEPVSTPAAEKPPVTPTASTAVEKDAATPPAPAKKAAWPGFRGPERDGIARGSRINTDWTTSPPVQMWRRPIGPGWSSFAVNGDLLYTQEQRGEREIVACYRVSTGEPVWRHSDPVRFYESNGGAGPRATPTLANGRVYAFGATGILNALDAGNGNVLWSHNVATEVDRKVPMWGFSSSPLVIDDVVIVAASGTLAAYDTETGKQRWVGPRLLGSYSSPHRATIDGVTQVLLMSGSGVTSIAPASGEILWKHEWDSGTTIVQPAVMPDGGVLINAIAMTGGVGTRRLAVKHDSGGWGVDERWTSNGLKPYFNDFVVHKGHAYGFDGSILACINLEDGKRMWKGGRYGNGQLILLPDQDLLLVLSEEGELALVGATTDQFKEIARFKAIEGKTWNHPVLVGDVLLVRNGEEMAAFRLPTSVR
jgi:outer membrane protein assembly factor BamB